MNDTEGQQARMEVLVCVRGRERKVTDVFGRVDDVLGQFGVDWLGLRLGVASDSARE